MDTSSTESPPKKRASWAAAVAVVALVAAVAGGYAWYLMSRDAVDLAIQVRRTGNPEEAYRMLREVVSKEPENARAHFELGKIYWQRNQVTDAANAFENAYRSDPRHKDAYQLAAVSLALRDNGVDRSREISTLEALVRQFPSDFTGWYLLGLARGAAGDAAGQIEALEQAVSLHPADAEPRAYLGIAQALAGNLTRAETELRTAHERAANAPATLAALGFVANLRQEYRTAIERLSGAVEGEFDVKTDALTQLGILLVAEGRFAEANQYLNQAFHRDNTNPAVRFFRALCLNARGLQPEALTEFEAVAGSDNPHAAEAAVAAAQTHLARGDLSAAREMMNQAGMLNAVGPVYHTTRGRIHAQSGELAAAQESYRRALQADPDFASARLENGLLFVQREMISQGIEELERYIELAGTGIPEARTEEIALLIEQLRRAVNREVASAPVQTATGRTSE